MVLHPLTTVLVSKSSNQNSVSVLKSYTSKYLHRSAMIALPVWQ